MPGERPEDLYQRLKQLEATVRGLTQELVESTERIRELEAALEEQQQSDREEHAPDLVDEQPPEESHSKEAEETEDDIIVA